MYFHVSFIEYNFEEKKVNMRGGNIDSNEYNSILSLGLPQNENQNLIHLHGFHCIIYCDARYVWQFNFSGFNLTPGINRSPKRDPCLFMPS